MTDQTKTDKKYDFKLEYTLVAQTPLIHFQHEQTGATLRATEVKPKLDHFLTKRIGEEEAKKWRIKQGSEALDYKLRIIDAKEAGKCGTIKDYKFYFGNMGGQVKEIVFRHVTLQIVCYEEGLRKYLFDEAIIKEFFILNNFGTRQSKGFGGFLVSGTSNEDIKNTLRACGYHSFGFAGGRDEQAKELMQHARVVYSVMKSGINNARFKAVFDKESLDLTNSKYQQEGQYIKGFALGKYLDGLKTGSTMVFRSDKAFIKSKVLKPARKISDKEKESFSYRYGNSTEQASFIFIRAILGLADHFEFRDDIFCNLTENFKYRSERVDILNFDIEKTDASGKCSFDTVEIKDGKCVVSEDRIKNKEGIKRFKSPITVKVFVNNTEDETKKSEDEFKKSVFFIFDDSYELMLDKTFIFLPRRDKKEYDCAIREKNYKKASEVLSKCKYLKTPAKFDVNDFIARFVEYFNNDEKVRAAFEIAFKKTPMDKKDTNELSRSKDLRLEYMGGMR